jgi:hypothetical protein
MGRRGGCQKAKGSGLVGAHLGPPASELKTLKLYFFFAKYNCLKIFIMFYLFNGNVCISSLIHLMDRPTCNEQPLDKFTLTIC